MAWGNPTEPAPQASAATALSGEWLNEREKLLLAWNAAQEVLARAKESEMTARLAVANFAFPVEARDAGKTNKQELPGGYTLKLADKINPKITATADVIDKAEDLMPTIGNEAPFLFERIIKWKPEFSIGEYNKLDIQNPTHKAVKDQVDLLVEFNRGTPGLEIVPPKETL